MLQDRRSVTRTVPDHFATLYRVMPRPRLSGAARFKFQYAKRHRPQRSGANFQAAYFSNLRYSSAKDFSRKLFPHYGTFWPVPDYSRTGSWGHGCSL
jgi:hypothetical protein